MIFVSLLMLTRLNRLERNLELHNPVALQHLNQGLSPVEIKRICSTYQVELDPDLIALYSWRNGVQTEVTKQHAWADSRGEFFPSNSFLNLEEALSQGAYTSPYPYSQTQIVPDQLLNHIICPFAYVGSFPYEITKIYLPCSTYKELHYNSPLYREGNSSIHDFNMEFVYDELSNLVDHINYIYEEVLSKNGLVASTIKTDGSKAWQSISDADWKRIDEYRYENNPYCAEVNQALFSCSWPSRDSNRR